MPTKLHTLFTYASLLFTSALLPAFSAVEISNASFLRQKLGLNTLLPYVTPTALKALKVAVLDNGFGNYQMGDTQLPSNTHLLAQYPTEFINKNNLSPELSGSALAPVRHGLSMAQMVWEMAGKQSYGPEFFLLNANGWTNFKRAVTYAIEQKVDIILYSQNWEIGGNFDGKGFINKLVSSATQKGIIWINAAGNYGGKVFQGKPQVYPGESPYFIFNNQQKTLRFTNHWDENLITLTLVWDNFTDNENDSANVDLDFELLNENGQIIGAGKRAQVKQPNDPREPSTLARERFTQVLPQGNYQIRLKYVAGEWRNAKNQVRVIVSSEKTSESIDFTNRSRSSEIMIPADNPQVITVGDASPFSSQGPTSDGRSKPEVTLADSDVQFSDGLVTQGTSNAAALFAGLVTVIKALKNNVTHEMLLKWASSLQSCAQPLSLQSLPYLVLNTLHSYGLNVYQCNAFLDREGRVLLQLPVAPINLQPLFQNVYSDAYYSGRSSADYRYYLGLFYQPYSRNYTIQSYFQASNLPENLPYDDLEGGSKRWIRLLAPQDSLKICQASQGSNNETWRSPQLAELVLWK